MSEDLKERLDTLAKQTGEASLFEATARLAALEAQLEEYQEMCIRREEYIASKDLWKDFCAFLALPKDQP